MSSIPQHNKAWLLKAAKDLARHLKPQAVGTALKIRQPDKTTKTETDGWFAVIGGLGKDQPRAEVWLDRFSCSGGRKLYVCFSSSDEITIRMLCKRAPKHLSPVRELTDDDVNDGKKYILKQPLPKANFNVPIAEYYSDYATHFFGFYDPTNEDSSDISPQFIEKATGFLLDVARSLPGAKEPDNRGEMYPRCENRKWVNSHLRRERSGFLAVQCKQRDKYRCKVCDMSFAEVYGDPTGTEFAEAHHILPLGTLPNKTQTSIEDLITVCANCHRMLHRMDGKPDDFKKLRAAYLKHRKARASA